MALAPPKKALWPVVLVLYCLAAGLLAVNLNQSFYKIHGPFYDSMDYYNHLAMVMQATQESGMMSALKASIDRSTVFLPWLFGALLSYVAEPSRILGVLIQMPLVFLQLFTGYRFFRATGASQARAVMYALPLISYPALIQFNGGLWDFRMDLSQALGFGSFLAALMTARLNDQLREWAWVGVVISVACLARATTPVYVTMIMSIAFLLDFKKSNLGVQVKKYALTTGVVVLFTGWFYVLSFNYLYYYYFVWNTDANARLPVQDSVQHLAFAVKHLGPSLLFVMLITMSVRVFQLASSSKWNSININWIALAGTIIPLGYLVVSGAGLNPFVSIVGIPGFIFFALHAGSSSHFRHHRLADRALSIAIAISLLSTVYVSVRDSEKTISDWIPKKEGLVRLTDAIERDIKTRNEHDATLAFMYLGSVDGSTVMNHLIFDKGYRYGPKHYVQKSNLAIGTLHFGFGAEAEWNKIPGDTDQLKIDHVLRNAMAKANYLIMADIDSDLPSHHRINRYSDQLRDKLAFSSQLEKLESGLGMSKSEKVSLYRIVR